MALTLQARAIADLVDENNIEAGVISYFLMDPAEPIGTAVSILNGWLLLLDKVTGGRIIAARVEFLPTLPNLLKNVPEVACMTSRTGNFAFGVEGSLHRWGFSVAALSGATDVLLDGKVIVTPGSPAGNLVEYMLVQNNALNNTSDQYQQLEALREAFLSFRKYTEQMARRSAALA